MQYNEFMELQQCLIAWFRVFQQYDSDRSGFIEANELVNVVTNLYGQYLFLPVLIKLKTSRNIRISSAFVQIITESVLHLCLSGYRITPQATETILKRYSRVLPRGGATACLCAFDDFVSVSVRLRAYTGKF